MAERSSTECNFIKHAFHETLDMYPNLSTVPSNDQQFRLNKINEIEDYFIAEIRNLSKYIASLDYFDQSLIVLSVATVSISVASFATVIGAPVWIMSASCRRHFQLLQDL